MFGTIDFTGIALGLMSQLGYWGMAIGLVLDSFGIPIPSEVLLMVGGALAATGRFNLWVVVVIGIVAQVIGGLIGYLVGRYGGEPLLLRYGKYVLISHQDLRRTHAAFAKYGTWMTAVGRCIPFIRGLIAYPAGVAEMNLGKFITFTTLGSAVWSALFVWLGYELGDNLEVVNGWMRQFTVVVILLIVVWVVWHLREYLPRFGAKK
jgi:membrane protein DedA with SNARE-associated domain